jgi:murein DD-endopeptidase MepM/ murein hydrolase activator NlpD
MAVLRRIFARTGLDSKTLRAGAVDNGAGRPVQDGSATLLTARGPTEEGALTDQLGALRALPLLAPLARYRITSDFGSRQDPVTGRQAQHPGIRPAPRC